MSAPDLDREVRYRIYRHLVESGHALTVGEIAAHLDLPEPTIEASLRRLADAHAIVLAPGSLNIWMAHPFSAVPTPYPVDTPGRRCWANCAWDALALPALLNVDAETATSCPDCGEPLTLRTRDGQLQPTDSIVHFAVPPRRFWENVGFT